MTPLWEFDKTLTERQKNITTRFFNDKHTKTIFHCHTGFGKTIVSLYICSFFQSVCILISQKTVYDQWLAYLKNLPVHLMTQWSPQSPGVLLMMIPTAYNQLKKKSFPITVDLLIIDEIHTRIKQYAFIHSYITYGKLLGLTATLPTLKHVDFEIYKSIFKGSYKISREERKVFHYKFIDTGFKPISKLKKFYSTKFKNYIVTVDYLDLTRQCRDNPGRIEKICNFIIQTIGDSGLILTKYVTTAETIHRALIEANKQSDLVIASTKVPRDHTIIVGTYSKLSIGFDTKKASIYLLDNVEDIRQSIGRLRNHDYIIYDIIDSHDLFYKHKKSREEIYVNMGGKNHQGSASIM